MAQDNAVSNLNVALNQAHKQLETIPHLNQRIAEIEKDRELCMKSLNESRTETDNWRQRYFNNQN